MMKRWPVALRTVGRWARNAGAAAFYIGLVAYLLMKSLLDPGSASTGLCQVSTLQEQRSPNERALARVSAVDCGAFTTVVSSVTVLDAKSGKKLGISLSVRSRGDDIRMRWTADSKGLHVSGFRLPQLELLNQDALSGIKLVLEPQT